MKIDKPGIYRGIHTADYFADPCPEPSLSQSIGKLIVERSAWHVQNEHPRLLAGPLAAKYGIAQDVEDEPEKYVKAQAIGNAAHAIIIGRGKDLEIIKANDFKGGEAKKARDAATAASKTPILEKHLAVASNMVASAFTQLKHHEDRDAFMNGAGEVMIAWQEDGIWFRSLIDWLHDDLRTVDDFKTTGMSVAPHLIGYRAEAGGWHVQAAFIERGLGILDPEGAGRRRYRWIAQEQDRPYALTSMHMDEHWMTMGRKVVNAAVQRWRAAIETGHWHGYPARAIVPEYPGFKESKWLERELGGEFESEKDSKLIMAG